MLLSEYFRKIPSFKGKIRLAEFLFRNKLNQRKETQFTGDYNISYSTPNSVEVIAKQLFVNGIYERDTIEAITELLAENDIFFDVGANLGAVTLPVAKLTGAKVYSFDASSHILHFLQKNVANNDLQVTITHAAVCDVNDDELKFYEEKLKHGGSALSPSYTTDFILVPTITLDKFCVDNMIDEIQLLKIDVQGFEHKVILGAEKLLEQKKIKNIILEFESWVEVEADAAIGTSQKLLLQSGYNLYTLAGDKIPNILTTGSHMIWARPN